MSLTKEETDAFLSIAYNLGVNSNDLYKLINFESGWNPAAKNPLSSARGLIQFMDATAADLGFADSLDLVTQHPSIIEQLPVVEQYLTQFKPFKDKQSLYLAVFYPAARMWNVNKPFPDSVQRSNPGIQTPADYINRVEGVKPLTIGIPMVAAIAAFFLFKHLKRKG